ncbi:MAG: hypothetical protein HKN74_10450 [Acidimicrobiia bacterium]|nr:hypothetical protein [Acidimicrobiia bacterium]NNF10694.1 hypothetical protein [Acidimicrobiia bacterium]NNL68429.1 hypothetical protein [Acidimicrobiia bacterium]
MTSRPRFQIRTGLGRALDVEHRSNRFVLAAAVAAGAGTLLFRWATEADDVWLWAFRAGAAVFLAWAIGRELDPDDTASAGVAAVLVIPLLALGAPSLASAGAVLVAARIAVRTTGVSAHWIDGIVLTAAAAYLGSQAETWPALGTLILALGTDRYAEPPGADRTLVFAAMMGVAAFVTAFWVADTLEWTQPTVAEWIVVGVVAAGGFLAIVNTQTPTSRADLHPGDLSETRLRFGRMLGLFTLVVGLIYVGGPSVTGLTPLWAALLATAALHYFRTYRSRTAQPPM